MSSHDVINFKIRPFEILECVIYRVIFTLGKSRFQRCIWWNFRFIPSGKLLQLFILIIVTLLLNILLSWTFVTSLNCSVMCRPPWWFECCFCRSSWIYCWLLLAVLSNYFGHLVTSTFLLCKFRGLPGSTPVSFPAMRRCKCLGMKRSSQPSSITPRKRAKKTCRRGSRREASNAKSRMSLFHFRP